MKTVKCTKTLLFDDQSKAFTAGKEYEIQEKEINGTLVLINDLGEKHHVSSSNCNWLQYFGGTEHPSDLIEKGKMFDELLDAVKFIKKFDNVKTFSPEWEELAAQHIKIVDAVIEKAEKL